MTKSSKILSSPPTAKSRPSELDVEPKSLQDVAEAPGFDPKFKYHKSAKLVYVVANVYSIGAFFFGYAQAFTNQIQYSLLATYGMYWQLDAEGNRIRCCPASPADPACGAYLLTEDCKGADGLYYQTQSEVSLY